MHEVIQIFVVFISVWDPSCDLLTKGLRAFSLSTLGNFLDRFVRTFYKPVCKKFLLITQLIITGFTPANYLPFEILYILFLSSATEKPLLLWVKVMISSSNCNIADVLSFHSVLLSHCFFIFLFFISILFL